MGLSRHTSPPFHSLGRLVATRTAIRSGGARADRGSGGLCRCALTAAIVSRVARAVTGRESSLAPTGRLLQAPRPGAAWRLGLHPEHPGLPRRLAAGRRSRTEVILVARDLAVADRSLEGQDSAGRQSTWCRPERPRGECGGDAEAGIRRSLCPIPQPSQRGRRDAKEPETGADPPSSAAQREPSCHTRSGDGARVATRQITLTARHSARRANRAAAAAVSTLRSAGEEADVRPEGSS